MSHLERRSLGWAIVGLLAALVVTNIALLVLLRTGGPLIGLDCRPGPTASGWGQVR